MFGASNEAIYPYGFKTDNLCVNAGFNGDGQPFNIFIRRNES